MRKNGFFVGILGMALTFGVLFTGCVTRNGGGDDGSKNSVVQYDGVYCYHEDDDYTSYLRFYIDNTVIDVSSTGTVEQIKSWFNKDNPNISKGVYKIKGTEITFQILSESGSIDYNGIIMENELLLNIHSNINGYEENNVKYIFDTW